MPDSETTLETCKHPPAGHPYRRYPSWAWGILIFLSLVTIVTAILAFSSPVQYLDSEVEFTDDDWKLAWAIPVGIISFLVIWSLDGWARWIWLKKKFKFTTEELEDIFGPRLDFKLEAYQQRFTDLELKKADGIPRKLNHIVTTLFGLFFLTVVLRTDPRHAIFFSMVAQSLNLLMSVIFLHSTSRFSWVLFGVASRIRDGYLARFNILMARATAFLAYLMIFFITGVFKDEDELEEDDRRLALLVIVLPTAIGDALGELVGTLWGRHQYRVVGLGEINKKSIEGSLAVWFGSIVPIYLSYVIFKKGDPNGLLIGMIIGVSSMIVEAIAPRSTDNYLLPVTNALWVWWFFDLDWLT